MSLLSDAKMDKTMLSVASLHDPSDEKEYWLRQTPESQQKASGRLRPERYREPSLILRRPEHLSGFLI
jgi:hypothetical protein